MNLMKKTRVALAGAAASLVGSSAFAAAPDLSTLTDAIDFSTATEAILVAAGALIVVYISFKAAKLVISAVRSA